MARPRCSAATVFSLLLLAGAYAAGAEPHLVPAPALDARALEALPRVALAPLDRAVLAAEDAAAEAAGRPMRFAVPHEVFLDPAESGVWDRVAPDLLRWRLRITADGAESINLGFSRYRLPPGGRLTITAADGSAALGPYTASDNRPHGELWTPVLLARDAVVELTLPEAERGQLELTLRSIGQGYRGFAPAAGPGTIFDKSGSCEVDVICSQGDAYRDVIRSVARITIEGQFLCSGAMINNTDNDLRPYFLTANHCSVRSGNAATVVSYWLFENTTCRTPGTPGAAGRGNGTLANTISGTIFRANYAPSDMTLLELSSAPPSSFRVHWAGWDRSSASPTKGICVHHPSGQEKRISFDNNSVQPSSYLGTGGGDGTHLRVVDWDEGTTEGGSSGSPLFNASRRIVGQLHGGEAACGNDDSDYFGRLSVSWTGGGTASTRLSNWLDPRNTGATSLGGLQPGGTGGSGKPAAPTNLVLISVTDTMVNLSWQDNAQNETDFRLEYAVNSGAFTAFDPLPANTQGAGIGGLQPNTTYSFRVRAHNNSGFSAYTNTVTVHTVSAPAAPSQLKATTLSSSRIRLDWRDNSSNETGFEIFIRAVATRNASGSPRFQYVENPYTIIKTVPANVTSTEIGDLFPDQTLNFVVRAVNGSGNSVFTPDAAVTTAAATVPGTCVEDGKSLCLLGDRFRVESFWFVGNPASHGDGNAIAQSNPTGFFWFFSPTNVELMVKVLDGTPLTNAYWFFYGALSNVEYWVIVTDVTNGARKTYYNPQGSVCGVGDTHAIPADTPGASAFAPAGAPASAGLEAAPLRGLALPALPGDKAATGSCTPSDTRLCLLGNRFSVEVDWTNQHADGQTGVGHAVPSATSEQTGYFWFFDPANLELVVKLLDGTAVNGKYWFFFGALSDVQYDITVRDTVTGAEKTYHNAPGNICGGADTQAL